jgi:hypothetical protein
VAYTQNRPVNEVRVTGSTTSIASTPVAATLIMPASGLLQRVMACAGGTTTGTITVAVTQNGSGTDLTSGGLTIAAGSNARAGGTFEFALYGNTNPAPLVAEGDVLVFTPSGGTGASIGGGFAAVIRAFT